MYSTIVTCVNSHLTKNTKYSVYINETTFEMVAFVSSVKYNKYNTTITRDMNVDVTLLNEQTNTVTNESMTH